MQQLYLGTLVLALHYYCKDSAYYYYYCNYLFHSVYEAGKKIQVTQKWFI